MNLNALTSAMRKVVEGMQRAARAPLHTLTPAQARAAYAAASQVLEIEPVSLPRVQDLSLVARDGAVLRLRHYAPSLEGNLPALLYFHGGGFTIGSIETHDVLCRELAHQAGCAVFSLDYRLAPEHTFPTAHDDAWDALTALVQHARDWGVDTQRLAVGGDSAGGTLAAACALQAAHEHLPLRLQLLFYPGLCAWQDTDSHHHYAHDPVIPAHTIRWFFDLYAPAPEQRNNPRFAPLMMSDLDALPALAPAWLGLAECDPLLDEGIAYADLMRWGGHSVDLEIYRGVTHEFIKMGRVIPQARQAHKDAATALRLALHG